jgi:ribonuclease P protein component
MDAHRTDAPRRRLARLKQRREFLRVAAARNSAARPGLVLQAARRPEAAQDAAAQDTAGDPGSVRYGLTVSRKVGNAVTRNRARRRLRAAAEATLAAHGVAGVDYVLIGRRDSVRRPFAALVDDLVRAMRKLGCWCESAGAGAKPEAQGGAG